MHTCNIHGVAAQKGRQGNTDGTPRKKGKDSGDVDTLEKFPRLKKCRPENSLSRVALPLPLLMVGPFVRYHMLSHSTFAWDKTMTSVAIPSGSRHDPLLPCLLAYDTTPPSQLLSHIVSPRTCSHE